MAAPVSVLSFAGHSSRVHRLQNLAQAAADAGAHYLDSTGEVGFVRKLRARHDTRARNTGATMVPAFGYDYVPGNLAAALAARVGGSAVRDRHRRWYAAWAQDLAGHTEGSDAALWLAEAAADDENLRAAIDAYSESPSEQLQLVVDCMALWHELGHNREGMERLEQALANAPAEASARPMATACWA